MYTLLLVDDERYVIESIKKNICWERTGITESLKPSLKKSNGRNSVFRLPGMQTTDLKQWTCLKKCSRMLL